MPRVSVDRGFSLCETVSGVFADICEGYDIDNAWLSWQFERAILKGEKSPLHVNTSSLVQNRPMKEGVDKVVFEVEFDQANPNTILCIRFNELPSRKHFLVTQTSIAHVREDTKCPLWIELPPGARKEDIGAIHSLLRVDICCNEWKDFLSQKPYTTLEQAHLVVASNDEGWLKNQIIERNMAVRKMAVILKDKETELDGLRKEIERLKLELEGKNASLEVALRKPATPPPPPSRKKPRLAMTPKTKAPKNAQTPKNQTPASDTITAEAFRGPNTQFHTPTNRTGRTPLPTGRTPQPWFPNLKGPSTAPAKTAGYETRHLLPAQTPTKLNSTTKRARDDDDYDDDAILYWS